jgi:serine/threonine protein kinase
MADEVLGGYRLARIMMTGQTSQVFEVVELSSHRHFAMKILLPEKSSDTEIRRMLFHEANVGMKLAHPNIIRIVTVNKSDKNPYFVMEFFPGGSLKARLLAKQFDFLRENAHGIIKQSATALAFMNTQNWVHRDVKPDNLLCNSSAQVKLIDFALAVKAEKPSFLGSLFRRKGKVAGTRSYMSPEQIRGDPLDGKADIYSFGATCYELVTGRPPFRAATSQDLLTKHLVEKPVGPNQFDDEITKDFNELVLRMLNKKKEDRPRDFHEILIALRTMRIYKSIAPKAVQDTM